MPVYASLAEHFDNYGDTFAQTKIEPRLTNAVAFEESFKLSAPRLEH